MLFFSRTGFLVWAVTCVLVNAARAGDVSFRNDIMAVLSKAGCNQGTCHGNLNGKNGFKLSLRGEDPASDFQALTRDTLGRRANPLRPADSLLLLKATATVPHEGGKRFGRDSEEYRLLASWIASGLPADRPTAPQIKAIEVAPDGFQVLVDPAQTIQLQVKALYSDGTRRDVTQLAVYEASDATITITPGGQVQRQQMGESSVQIRYLDKRAVVHLAFIPNRSSTTGRALSQAWGGRLPSADTFIDYHISNKLQMLRVLPSPLSSDTVFLRRAYLDALGMLPTLAETSGFLSDPDASKRSRLIDRLLQRPEFADFWAQKWADLLRNEEKVLDRKGVQVFYQWIRQCIADDKPLNEFARDLLTGRGSTYTNPPANFYRALRDPQARAEAVAQVFFGVRLQCARCHNHPFDQWSQDDYHRLAAFFPRIQYRIVQNNRRDGLDKHEFDGEQVVWLDRESEVTHPRHGEVLRPRLLGTDTADIGSHADRLQVLADWTASPANPFFAQTQVNRIWFHMMGRGLVDPVDDFRPSNPPVNGPLLEALTRDFIAHHFSLRHAVRTIMNSRTYQLAAQPNENNREDETNFSHSLVRPLQAEQLLDALVQVTGVPEKFNGYPLGTRSGQLPGVRPFRQRDRGPTQAEQFLSLFGKPNRLLTCECERSADPTMGQAFELLTGPLLNRLVSEPDNRLGKMLSSGKSNHDIVEELYLASLCRFPKTLEWESMRVALQQATDRRVALEDILWAILNSKEFLFRQ
jgi:hypothetical protein